MDDSLGHLVVILDLDHSQYIMTMEGWLVILFRLCHNRQGNDN